MSRGAWGLALLGILAGGVAYANPGDDLREGTRAHDLGDLHRAEPLLRAAARGLRNEGQRARAWLYLGLTLAALHDPSGARRAFRSALQEDPDVFLERDRIAPKVRGLFHEVRQTVTGKLRVESEAGARVMVAGGFRGTPPVVLRLPVGRYDLRVLSQDGYRIYERRGVLVHARRLAVVHARLVPRSGRLRVTTLPRAARIYEGRRLLGNSGAGPLALPAGRHRFVLRLKGHYEETREMVVEPETDRALLVRLRPLPVPWYRRRGVWGRIALGLSAAALAGSLTSGALARSAESDLAREERERTLTQSRYLELSSSAEARARTANVLLGVAGAAAVSGVLLLVFGRKASPARAGVQVVPAPGGLAAAGWF